MARIVKGPDGITHSFPDDATDAEISEALGAMQQTAAPEAPAEKARTWSDTARSVGTAAANALPAIGGMVGGIVGGIPGAAAGGAAGQGFRTLAQHATEIPAAVADVARNLTNRETRGDTIKGFMAGTGRGAVDAGIQGGVQGALQGAGDLAAYGASKAAPWLMNRALNLTDKLSREFPNLSTTMIDHALTVTQGGLNQARKLLKVAKTEANAALTTAHANGATVPVTAATDGLSKTLLEVMNSKDIEGGLKALAGVERKIMSGRPSILTPMAADALKESLQTESKGLYAAIKMGQGRPNATVHAQALMDMAENLNKTIGDITTKAGAPGYRAANAAAQEMIGAERGITKGIRPGANLYQAMVRPGVGAVVGAVGGAEAGGTKGAAIGSLVGTALMSPAGMSRLAVTITKPSMQAILKQSPRLAAAVAQIMAGGTPADETAP